jgi:hypothetical protein
MSSQQETSVNPDDLSLPEAMREIQRRYGKAPAYHQLWHGIARGVIPAEQVRGRWKIHRADLPRVAAALGISAAA